MDKGKRGKRGGCPGPTRGDKTNARYYMTLAKVIKVRVTKPLTCCSCLPMVCCNVTCWVRSFCSASSRLRSSLLSCVCSACALNVNAWMRASSLPFSSTASWYWRRVIMTSVVACCRATSRLSSCNNTVHYYVTTSHVHFSPCQLQSVAVASNTKLLRANKSNQIKWFIRYSSTDAGLQQYRGNVFTTN